jgi:hypothetical protein
VRIFALETDTEKLKKRFLSQEEREIRTVFFHGFRFYLAVARLTFWTFVIAGLSVGLGLTGLPTLWGIVATGVIWFIFVFLPLLRAYLDWRYDFLLITTDKVIVVDQSSIFHQKITPMNLENFASVSAETQFWNLFPFGMLNFNLKEGTGSGVNLRYIPHAHDIASCVSDAITTFQRRKDLRRYGGAPEDEQQ